ncbi:hypothetical protein [Paracoccus luteus]|uniref:hypothetical protein n=1 Tax=Paracoccus luteus TaxID=2508543 RepID=UPI00106F777B|nr:hypothetical protein [Paracoccus luteus]
MTNQLLARYDIADYDTWKAAFDADSEDRGNASMSVLQIWREGGSRAWVLYQVANAAKARDYLGQASAVFDSQAGVARTEFHMLETA